MGVYSIGRRTTNTTSGQAAMDVAVSSGQRLTVWEWQILLAAPTASTYGLNRATAIGTRTTPTALLQEDAADPAPSGIVLVDSALAHSVQPTLSTDYLRRVALPATIGAGVFWTFPRGLKIAVSLSLVLQNLASNGVLDSSVVTEV